MSIYIAIYSSFMYFVVLYGYSISERSAKKLFVLFGRLILLRKVRSKVTFILLDIGGSQVTKFYFDNNGNITKQIYFKVDVSEGSANSIGYSNDANDNLTTITETAGTASVHYS